MEFLIFFGFWHKNSVIFREIFASGGGKTRSQGVYRNMFM